MSANKIKNWKLIKSHLWVDGAKFQQYSRSTNHAKNTFEDFWICASLGKDMTTSYCSCTARAMTSVTIGVYSMTLVECSPAEEHNHDLDKLTMISEEIEETMVKVPNLDPVTVYADVRKEWFLNLDKEEQEVSNFDIFIGNKLY